MMYHRHNVERSRKQSCSEPQVTEKKEAKAAQPKKRSKKPAEGK